MNKFIIPNESYISSEVHDEFILPNELLDLIILQEFDTENAKFTCYYLLKLSSKILYNTLSILRIKEKYINFFIRKVIFDTHVFRYKSQINVQRVLTNYTFFGKMHRQKLLPAITDYYHDKLVLEEYYFNGENHRNEKYGPAICVLLDQGGFYPTGECYKHETYYKHGKRHRNPYKSTDGGPSDIVYSPDGNIQEESYIVDDKYYVFPEELPNEIYYFSDGRIRQKCYYNEKGILHRDMKKNIITKIPYEQKPALISYLIDDKSNQRYLYSKEYYIDGKLHRFGDKPASKMYYDNGQVKSKNYYDNGKRNPRSDSSGTPLPLEIKYDRNGKIINIVYSSRINTKRFI